MSAMVSAGIRGGYLTNARLSQVSISLATCSRAVAIHSSLGLADLVTLFPPDEYKAGFDGQNHGSTVKAVFDFTAG